MAPEDRELLIQVNFRFASWLRRNHPGVLQSVVAESLYPSCGVLVRTTPTLFWAEVGYRPYADLSTASPGATSVLDRVIDTVRAAPPAVQNEILVGFVEGHMFSRPDSPLAAVMGLTLGRDLSGLC